MVTTFGEDRTFVRILETLPQASRMVSALHLGPGKVSEPGAFAGAEVSGELPVPGHPGAPQGFAVTSLQAVACR